jgi:hypothetical protein
MQQEIIFVVEEASERGYEARALGYPIFTEAETSETLKGMLKDRGSLQLWGDRGPSLIRLHLVKDEVIAA